MNASQTDIRERASSYLNNIKGITDAQPTKFDEIAGGTLVTLKLKRDGIDGWGHYFEKGNVKQALFGGDEIARFVARQLSGKTLVNSLFDLFSANDSYSVSLRFLGIGLVVIYFGFLFSGNGQNIFVFLVTMGIAVFLISIAARVYFSDFKVPDVIPERDRDLLVDIIKKNGKDGLDTYIKLSSLYGFTGNITKLGLSGLPLITVALTVFFASLAAVLWGLSINSDHSIVANMMDLAKLTLGAFIGSFVQRNVSETAAANTGGSTAIAPTS